ncbi:MAG TPA: ligase-associated DNA damage response exonuclease [Tepidisphaeraceae bacterium]|jgi:putative mRNA 3-end processing factor|nr:ligase-associated DNA damage response exonuclease [Tepidisphaeraceae bacterium]
MDDLITSTENGLYCPAGDFHIDAWGSVGRNIVTHGHSDHARFGAASYLCTRQSAPILQKRLGDVSIDARDYGDVIDINGVRVSLHPAGHILGSAQVRIEHRGQICVASGDYKRQPDPTCAPFEPIRCHTFITECTFGLPIFHWTDPTIVMADINAWWRDNHAAGRTSMLAAYSLGKAQRVLAGLDASTGPILLHGAVVPLVELYRQAGVTLPPTEHASVENAKLHRGRAFVIAPPGALNSTWVRKFAPFSLGAASGWMRVRGFRRRKAADRGFVLSDHVDFDALLQTIKETGAEHVMATHGYTTVLARLLNDRGQRCTIINTRFGDDEDEPIEPAALAESEGAA